MSGSNVRSLNVQHRLWPAMWERAIDQEKSIVRCRVDNSLARGVGLFPRISEITHPQNLVRRGLTVVALGILVRYSGPLVVFLKIIYLKLDQIFFGMTVSGVFSGLCGEGGERIAGTRCRS